MEYHSETITLDQPGIDWLTITSFEPLVYDVQNLLMTIAAENGCKVSEGHKTMQYLGRTGVCQLGSIFCGSAEQRGVNHYMMQISGELCNVSELLIPIAAGVREGWLRCRRIDLQMTCIEPASWNQWGFFNRQKLIKKTVGWVESSTSDGERLATVYLGSRLSGKFLRVYEKWIGKTRLLRCEYELKGNTAQSFCKMIFDGTSTSSALLKLLIQLTDDKELSAIYLPALEYVKVSDKPKILQNEPKTEKWLRETVFPSFHNYISSHQSNPEVMKLFKDAITAVESWEG